jgi:hypothetical protein
LTCGILVRGANASTHAFFRFVTQFSASTFHRSRRHDTGSPGGRDEIQ